MEIVILDGQTLNPGDLNWDGIAALGDCTVYDRSASEEIVARAEGAEIILINKTERLRYECESYSGRKLSLREYSVLSADSLIHR